MYRVKFEDGTYAYKFDADEIEQLKGQWVTFEDDPLRVIVGPIQGEWKLDYDYRVLTTVESLNPEDRLILSGFAAEDPKPG